MTQAYCERRDLPVPTRWLYAGSDLSRPGHSDQCAARPLMRSELAEMPVAGSPPRLSTHPDRFLAALHPPPTSALTSNPHSARCPAGSNFPRLRALALFGRLSPERAYTLVIAGVQKPAHFRTSRRTDFRISSNTLVCCRTSDIRRGTTPSRASAAGHATQRSMRLQRCRAS